ncbi:MAG TPA: hypothetical protein PLZ93_21085 [Nocardioides sp.]|uniref:hypothetical protein n=1 Tax=uncultured Nocardioides sp. TaxID=198441 RepID=UPI000EEEC3D0|nr:hypothetical protein [uncultured Nocardioides sp.]HCB06057.1 hypothetical protein [Nocardioides sp.]HRD64246.1 hypothetical protein [Nocardioides sp.]HRI98130.1 hypothetical protein [Nocardioides sp.]HRK47782.1 hypothetical protein [Nocardioides sp.]
MTVSITSPAPSFADDRYVVVSDPRPGTIVELAPGSQLAVSFRRGIGPSQWYVTERPGYLIELTESGHEFQFLVFESTGAPVPLRLERRRPDREMAHEVCELLVVPVPVTGGAARTSSSSSPRTA